jgi:hypothetical protein
VDAEQRHRRARREFIRRHHPDRGGDSAEFVAGLAELDVPAEPEVEARPAVYAYRDPPWPRSIVTAALQRLRRRGTRRRLR